MLVNNASDLEAVSRISGGTYALGTELKPRRIHPGSLRDRISPDCSTAMGRTISAANYTIAT